MNSSTPKSIVVVGGGASATLLVAQLSIQLITEVSTPVIIYVIDDSDANKGSIAYQVQHPSFLLNVTANQMGAYHDKPDDFYQWLQKYPTLWRNLHTDFNSIIFQPNDFVPRMIYGAYLRWVFDEAKSLAQRKNIRIHKINARATKVNVIDNKLHISTDQQTPIIADTIIFATGNTIQKHQDLTGPHIFESPYCNKFLQEDWLSIKNIIILGSGLSMVDAVQYLEQKNYNGNIHVISRHGLIPLPHSIQQNHQETPVFSINDLNSAQKVVRKLRAAIDINITHGINWQKTIHAFRMQLVPLWLSLTTTEQEKLKRFLPWWNVARHRIPEGIHEKIKKLQQEGRLTIIKGDIQRADGDGEYFLLNVNRNNHKTLFIKSEKLLICSGYKGSYDSLLDICGNLLYSKEQVKKHFDYNRPSLSKNYPIYALGPALTEILFETTAINEIRQQSNIIAAEIAFNEQFSLTASSKTAPSKRNKAYWPLIKN